MKLEIETLIMKLLYEKWNLTQEVTLLKPPSKELGDFTTNVAFLLAKQLQQSPLQIATLMQESLLSESFSVKVIAPGFLNFFINQRFFLEQTLTEVLTLKEKYVSLSIGAEKKISVEHTAANPNKHLHIGHLRNFSIADTLVRVFRSVGYTVHVQYFLNNQGLQVAKVVWGFQHLEALDLQYLDLESESFDSIAAKVYVAAEKAIDAKPEIAEAVRNLIQNMEQGNNEKASFSEGISRKILKGQLETTSLFGVYYNEIVTESSMTQSGEVDRIITALLETGKAVIDTVGKNENCVVLKGLIDKNGNEIPEKVLRRSDGTAVYTIKDIVFHLWKFGLMDVSFAFEPFLLQENGDVLNLSTDPMLGKIIQESAEFHVNVVDQRQSYPLEVVKESLSLLGFPEQAAHCFHLAYETVALSVASAEALGLSVENNETKSIAMSGRKGIEVSINHLLGVLTEHILEKNKEKEDRLTYEEAQKMAASALRYYMVKYSYNTIIVFDLDEALRTDGDGGLYLMYAYVRAQKILQKADVLSLSSTVTWSDEQVTESMLSLVSEMAFARDILRNVAENFAVNQLAEYTYKLAKTFTSFYQSVNVINEKDEKKRIVYIQLIQSFLLVYGQLLDILGMYKPDRM